MRQLAKRLDMPHATLSRYETGSRHPRPEDVARICAAIGVNGAEFEALITLARDTNRAQWLSVGLTDQQRQLAALIEYELAATSVTCVSPLLVPGLLQTSDYARTIMRVGGIPDDEVELRVATRMGRRDALTRPDSPHLLALVGEAALKQHIGGPEIMRGQLNRLMEAAAWPKVDLRVVPFSAGWHPGLMGSFIVVVRPEGEPLVHVETLTSGVFLHESKDTGRYLTAADTVHRLAMGPTESLKLIADAMSDVDRMKGLA